MYKNEYEKEIVAVRDWFAGVYREKFEKCIRRIMLGITMRDGSDPQEALNALFEEAETKANRIKELENLIGENNGSNNN